MRPYGEIKNVSQKYETDVFHILVSLSGLVDAILVMIVDAILVMIVDAILSSIKVRVFFGKSIEKKHLCRHDKNSYYFCKANIPVINLIVGSRNMIKV